MKYYRMQQGVADVRDICEMMPKGVTRLIGCCLQDGTEVVVKYPNNPFGNVVLISEIIGACVCDLIKVPMPEYGLCNLSEEIICTSDLYGPFDDGIDESNAGICFFSKRYNHTTVAQEYAKESNGLDGVLIVLYDYILNNCDKHEGNLLQVIGTDELICIDNSHIIVDKNDMSGDLNKYLKQENLMKIDYFVNDIEFYSKFLKGYNLQGIMNLASTMMNQISKKDLLDIKSYIPAEWVNSVEDESIDIKLEIIGRRIQTLDVACEKIMEVVNG